MGYYGKLMFLQWRKWHRDSYQEQNRDVTRNCLYCVCLDMVVKNAATFIKEDPFLAE